MDRFMHQEIICIGPVKRFDKMVITFCDPDGLELELVALKSSIDERKVNAWKELPFCYSRLEVNRYQEKHHK